MPAPRSREGQEPVETVSFNLPPAYIQAWNDEALVMGVSRSELLRRLTEKVPALKARLETLGVQIPKKAT